MIYKSISILKTLNNMDNKQLEDRVGVVGGKGAHLEWLSSLATELGYTVAPFAVIDTTMFDTILTEVGAIRKLEVIRGFAPSINARRYDKTELIRVAQEASLNPFGIEHFTRCLDRIEREDSYAQEFLRDTVHELCLAWSWKLTDNLQGRLQEIHLPFQKKKYVMRSSATCEDGKEDSYAGLFITEGPVELSNRDVYAAFGVNVLSTYDFKEFLASIGSIYGDFLKHREVKSIDRLKPTDKMAIIIQLFVHTNPSGVVFTRLPEEENILTLETVADTCNWVVNGNGTYIMDFNRKTRQIEDQISPNGVKNPMTEQQTRRVYDVAIELERRYGQPLDIEFGFFNGELYLFQARPISVTIKTELVRPPREGFELLAKTPICINSGAGEGILVRYDGKAQELLDFDSQIGRPYILITNNHKNAWSLSHITPKEHCVGAVVAGDRYMSRICHNSNDIRRSNIPVLGINGIENQVDALLVNSTPQGVRYSECLFGVHSANRRGIFYKR